MTGSSLAAAITRRFLLAAASASVGLGGVAESARAKPWVPKTFVLVHGSFHGGWCWIRVANLLEAKGCKVYTPTLTGLGDRVHLMNADIDLETHVTDVVNLIRFERLSNVHLVGHSYAGAVISGVAERILLQLSAVTFLDAFMPDDNQSIVEITGGMKAYDDTVAQLAKGEILLKPFPAKAFNVNVADESWIDLLMTPHPLKSQVTRLKLTGARDRVPLKTYIRAVERPSAHFDMYYARCKADPAWKTYEAVKCGHDVMVDAPEELTDMLLNIG